MLAMPDISMKKILLIDDEEDILQLLETVLKKEGFSLIYKASTGQQGIELCRVEQPDHIPDFDSQKNKNSPKTAV